MLRLLSLCAVAACSHPEPASPVAAVPVKEPVLALLPDGMQLVVEIDLARLKKNAVVGDVATRALAQLGADTKLPGLPVAIAGSPLANADQIVLAAYGVGTDHAAS